METMHIQVALTLYLHRPSISEEDLKILFSSNGGVVKGFKFFQ
jgi:hypothetical protein